MKRIEFDRSWPESWQYSYPYDQIEVYGNDRTDYGYAYAYRERQAATFRLVREVLPEGARILDVAAAQGNFSLLFAEQGYDVTWNDLRSELEGYVRLKHEYGLIRYAPGNVFDVAWDEMFDCVLITEVIEHVAHPDVFLEKISQLVRPGGYIVMSTPNGAYFRNSLPRFSACTDPSQFEHKQFMPNSDGHIFLLWPDEVVSLACKSGLKVDKVEFFTSPLMNGHLKMHYALPYVPRVLIQTLDLFLRRLPTSIAQRLMVHTCARFIKPGCSSL